ncbi:MAG: 50S ribosomal protein L21 [Actinomycetota bacterium]
MYAVIRTGGKQQKVKPGDIIEVEYLHSEGDSMTFQPLLVVDDEGTTHVGKEIERAVVTAKLLGEQKGEKVNVFKYKNKSGYSRRQGHRQLMTLLEITEVKLPAQRASTRKPEPEAEKAEKAEKPAKAAEAESEPAG